MAVQCSCGADVRLGDPRCAACGAVVSPELRKELEHRLEAYHSEYREAKHVVHRAAGVVLIVGLLYVAFGLLVFVARGGGAVADPSEAHLRFVSLCENLAIGAAFVSCYFIVRRSPRAGFGAALIIWLAVIALGFSAWSFVARALLAHFISAGGIVSLFAKIVAASLLLRGFLAARRLHAIRSKLEAGTQ